MGAGDVTACDGAAVRAILGEMSTRDMVSVPTESRGKIATVSVLMVVIKLHILLSELALIVLDSESHRSSRPFF